MGSLVVQILLPLYLKAPFDYSIEENVPLGTLVLVPFGKKQVQGIVWAYGATKETPNTTTLKRVSHIYHEACLPTPMLRFIAWVAQYTLTPLGQVLRLVLPIKQAFETKTRKPLNITTPLFKSDIVYSPDQTQAIKALTPLAATHQVYLIHGVTGSGKTEVYFDSIQQTLAKGKKVLILLPEISLSHQWVDRFCHRFSAMPLLWHSQLTPSMRRKTWEALIKHEGHIIIGARSALFLPIHNLGLIIVDEEHETSFKQEEQVIYHARDMAIVRAKLENIPLILVSATPSMESCANVLQKKYQLISLRNRYNEADLPVVSAIDMREHAPEKQHWLSPLLIEAIKNTLTQQGQVLLFLNRRGYAPLTLCRVCGYRHQCPNCTNWLTQHRAKHKLICHYCGFEKHPPLACPECQNENTQVPCGPGVERVEEDVHYYFPEVKTAIFTSDTINHIETWKTCYQAILHNEISILIGTQILAKGHHFPHLKLVGVIDADLSLQGGDLRASEKTFQLLQQVAGRAGRESQHSLDRGRVFLQTYTPEHPVIKTLQSHDYERFIKSELQTRHMAGYPPFGQLTALIITGTKQAELQQFLKQFMQACPPPPQEFHIFGPIPAPLFLLRNQYRYRLLIKSPRTMAVQQFLTHWLQAIKIPHGIQVKVDIDPYQFL